MRVFCWMNGGVVGGGLVLVRGEGPCLVILCTQTRVSSFFSSFLFLMPSKTIRFFFALPF